MKRLPTWLLVAIAVALFSIPIVVLTLLATGVLPIASGYPWWQWLLGGGVLAVMFGICRSWPRRSDHQVALLMILFGLGVIVYAIARAHG